MSPSPYSVVYLIAPSLTDLSASLPSIGSREDGFRLPRGRGDEARSGSSYDSRKPKVKGPRTRDLYEPVKELDTIKVKARNFY